MRLLIVIALFINISSFSQSALDTSGEAQNHIDKDEDGQKTLSAHRITSSITIDGLLDEAAWAAAEIGTDFITTEPVPGLVPNQKTKVRVLYDDDAIYISGILEEVSRDSIMTELVARDEIGNTDFLAVMLDTYNNGTDGIVLAVSSTGVQYDATKDNEGDDDDNWDAVWESAVDLTDKGWTCEMRIPYAAIRFNKSEMQEWTINFIRRQSRLNLSSSWSEIDPNKSGVFTQSGLLTNLKDIEPPLRLSLRPYLSTYATHNHDKNAAVVNSSGYSYNVGMDVKYGINDAFTLDMTLIPDFGQVEADDLIVNLSPFELFLSDKRPFFTEGLELFSKADIFYTRRVGGTALNYYDIEDNLKDNETIDNNPQIPQLLNATKVSGRNSNGLAVGVFNAVEARTIATVRNTENNNLAETITQPLTNYSVIVMDQNLKNNSYFSVINTNVWRKGSAFYDANVIATDFNFKDKGQNYSLSGVGAYSVQSYADADNNTGHRVGLNLSKISGTVRLWSGYEEISRDYDHNDLGFLRNANVREFEFGAEYKILKQKGIFNTANFWAEFTHSRHIDPNVFTNNWYNIGMWGQLTNFWNINIWSNYGTAKNDYFEPRTGNFSRFLIKPAFNNIGFWVGTDFRKSFRMQTNFNIYNMDEEGRWGFFYALEPRYRFSDKLSASFRWSYNVQYDDTGWVADGPNGEIYIGQRDYRNIRNLANISYTFNNTTGINLRVRHDWTTAAYNTFHEITLDGQLPLSDYRDDIDFSNSFFSVDCVFNWNFAPGSDLNIVWKNNIGGANEDQRLDYRNRTYIDGVKGLADFAQQNSLSVRLTYFIDQSNIKKWF